MIFTCIQILSGITRKTLKNSLSGNRVALLRMDGVFDSGR